MKIKSEAKELEYLNYRPRRVYWKHVVGPPLSPDQESDLVFDAKDYQLRQLVFTSRTTV